MNRSANAPRRLPDPRTIEGCVVVDRSVPIAPAPPWWLYAAALALPLGQMAVIIFANAYGASIGANPIEWRVVGATLMERTSWWLLILPAIVLADELLAARRRRGLRDSIRSLPAPPERSAAEEAWMARASAAARRRPDRLFDAEEWRTTDAGRWNSLIVFDNVWPRAALATPPGEEVDLGAGRERGPQERRAMIWTLVLAALFGISGSVYLAARGAEPVFTLGVLGAAAIPFGVALWRLAERAGVSLFSIGGVVAAPGRVEARRLGRFESYTPEEATIVLERMRPPMAALGAALRAGAEKMLDRAPALRAWWRGLVVAFIRKGWLTRWRRLERRVGLRKFRRPVRAMLVRPGAAPVRIRFLSGREDPGLADLVARWLM